MSNNHKKDRITSYSKGLETYSEKIDFKMNDNQVCIPQKASVTDLFNNLRYPYNSVCVSVSSEDDIKLLNKKKLKRQNSDKKKNIFSISSEKNLSCPNNSNLNDIKSNNKNFNKNEDLDFRKEQILKLAKGKSRKSINSNIDMNNNSDFQSNKSISDLDWDKNDDKKLHALVKCYGENNWDKISEYFNYNKTSYQCISRWTDLSSFSTAKGPWSIEEDKKLIEWIKENGPCNWTGCSVFIKNRSGKQCRERWANALNPLLKKGQWEMEEDYIIFKLFKLIGSKWSTIASYLIGRTENSTKNRFYSTLRRYAGELSLNDSKSKNLSFFNLMQYFNIAYIEKTKDFDFFLSKIGINKNESKLNITNLKQIISEYQVQFDEITIKNRNNNHAESRKISTTKSHKSFKSNNELDLKESFRDFKKYEYKLKDELEEFKPSFKSINDPEEFNNYSKNDLDVEKNTCDFNKYNEELNRKNSTKNGIVQPIINQTYNNNFVMYFSSYFQEISNKKEKERIESLKQNLYSDKYDEGILTFDNQAELNNSKNEDLMNFEDLTFKIDNFCNYTSKLKSENINEIKKSQESPNNLIESDTIQNGALIDHQKISNLFSQLNDLEELLKITKSEIKKINT